MSGTTLTGSIASSYVELPPPRNLRDRLVCLWSQRIDERAGEFRHPVLPDGCMDIVWMGTAPPAVAGPATHPLWVGLPAGTSVSGVRFQPGWASAFLGIAADQLLDQHVPLADIWRPAACGGLETYDGQQALPAKLAARLEELDGPDPAVRTAVEWIMRHPEARAGVLARAVGLGERQLRRLFRAALGYGPKTFQRIVRFQRLLASAPASRDSASLAVAAGYSDQAHMCREVRRLAGEPPGAILGHAGAALAMSELFNTPAGGRAYLLPRGGINP